MRMPESLRYKSILAGCLAALAAVLPAVAATYHVNPEGTGDFTTIQEAINACVDGDSVLLADGTYRDIQYQGIRYWGKAITVSSQSGNPERCVIDAEGRFGSGFYFCHDETEAAILEDITVINGYSWTGMGGGILIDNASPTIRGCILRDNLATHGGGIFIDGICSPVIEDCHIHHNSADPYYGGGGGGIYFQGSPVIRNCLIEHNTAGELGVPGGGGGIRGSGEGLIIDCVIRNNQAGSVGGGISVATSPEIVNCLVIDNIAGDYAGGIMFLTSLDWNPRAQGCTIVGNAAPIGSAITNAPHLTGHPPTVATLENCIIAFNEGDNPVWAFLRDWPFEFLCTDIYGNGGGDWLEPYAYQQHQAGNLCADPLFCDLEGRDLTLFNTSPCLPANNECGVLIGAQGQGCTMTATRAATWSAVKALY